MQVCETFSVHFFFAGSSNNFTQIPVTLLPTHEPISTHTRELESLFLLHEIIKVLVTSLQEKACWETKPCYGQ